LKIQNSTFYGYFQNSTFYVTVS